MAAAAAGGSNSASQCVDVEPGQLSVSILLRQLLSASSALCPPRSLQPASQSGPRLPRSPPRHTWSKGVPALVTKFGGGGEAGGGGACDSSKEIQKINN